MCPVPSRRPGAHYSVHNPRVHAIAALPTNQASQVCPAGCPLPSPLHPPDHHAEPGAAGGGGVQGGRPGLGAVLPGAKGRGEKRVGWGRWAQGGRRSGSSTGGAHGGVAATAGHRLPCTCSWCGVAPRSAHRLDMCVSFPLVSTMCRSRKMRTWTLEAASQQVHGSYQCTPAAAAPVPLQFLWARLIDLPAAAPTP